jgi:hypothetical protein
MWVKTGSLLTTHPNTGADLVEPANVRNYFVASAKHGSAGATTAAPTTCSQFDTQVEPLPLYRGLWTALESWVASGTLPPASATTSVAAGTGVFVPTNTPNTALGIGVAPQALVGYPAIPSSLMQYSGLVTVRNYWNFGPRYNQGIMDTIPPTTTGSFYATAVPKVDQYGNDLGGIRLPEVTVPTGTNSGWALRSAAYGGSASGTDGCEAAGQFIPFAATDAGKVAGDPRPSLTALYKDKAGYVAARTAAANALLANKLILQNDATAYATNAAKTITIVANPNFPSAYVYTW